MSVALTVPAYAAGQYGYVLLTILRDLHSLSVSWLSFVGIRWDPLELGCWYTSSNMSQRLAWQVRILDSSFIHLFDLPRRSI